MDGSEMLLSGGCTPGRVRVFGSFVLYFVATSTSACKGPLNASAAADGAVGNDSAVEFPSDSDPQTEVGVTGPCTIQTMTGSSVPVTGSIRGSRVDAVVRDNAMQTNFLGPGGSGSSAYAQSFSGTDGTNGSLADEFVFRMPSDVVSASLSGWAGATAAEVGLYPTTGCGGFVFEMRLPIPSGVVCPLGFGNCGPDCEGGGEIGVCMPAQPKVRYRAVPGGPCSSSGSSAAGDWQLMLASVCPHAVSDTLINFETHGHLTATLINEADASDSVAMNLDF